MIRKKQVTINDIARLAGVSKKSVSRVLNGESGVSETTRERVQAIMAEQGYRPDRRARALAGNRSYLLAIAYNNPNSAYVLELLQGVLEVANTRGYEVIMHPVDIETSSAEQQLLDFLRRSGIDGLILSPPLSDAPEALGELTRGKWPVARIAGDDISLNIPQVRFDDRAAALAVTNHLLQLGHRRIGFVGGGQDSAPSRRRLAGFRDAMAGRGQDVNPAWQAWGEFTFSSGLEAGRRLLTPQDGPTALMCCNDQMAAGVVHAAQEAGLSVPGDLSVTGFDDAPIAREFWPPLTTVSQPVEAMGSAATEQLIDWLEGRAAGSTVTAFSHTLVERSSAAAAPG